MAHAYTVRVFVFSLGKHNYTASVSVAAAVIVYLAAKCFISLRIFFVLMNEIKWTDGRHHVG